MNTSTSKQDDIDGKELQDQGFAAFFAKLPPKPDTTIRFFDRNDYYTVHGNDANFVAKEFYKTMAVLKRHKTEPIDLNYINISKSNFENLIQDLLLVRRYCIEIYKRVGGRSSEFVFNCKASPANLTEIEDLLFTQSNEVTDSQGVIAVKVRKDKHQTIVGVSCGDAVLRKIQVAEFLDDDGFSFLQAVIVQLGPKECLIPSSIGDQGAVYKVIKEMAERNHLLVTECKASAHFSVKDNMADLNRLVKFRKGEQQQISSRPEYELSIAMSCTVAVIKYLDLMKDEKNYGQFTLNTFQPEQYVRLDVSAVKALAILPKSPKDTGAGHSMLGLLNKCRTAGGQRLLSQWLKQPLIDIAKINERLDVVEALVENNELRQTLHDISLRKVPDLQRFSTKFQRRKATLQDCYRIYLSVQHLEKLRKLLSSHEGKHKRQIEHLFCQPIKELEKDFEKYLEMVESTIDLDEVEKGEYLIRSDLDEELKELRQNLDDLEEDIRKDAKRTAVDLGIDGDKVLKLEKNAQIGWHYRITRKEEKILRNRKNYYTIDAKNNGVRFHSSNLRQLNSDFVSLRDNVELQQKKVVDLVIEIAAGYCEPLSRLCDIMSHLDVLVSFSMASIMAPRPYVRPIMKEKGSGVINLVEARHPLVEVHKTVSFVANDIKLDHDDSIFHIITGPNMGGKSTYIRSIALNVLMAQIGCFVACDRAEISAVDSIMTRVGAGDKPTRGISTFMAEMLETSAILRSATKYSLIIIDELGRGTSTYDGFGLAWAISEHLCKKTQSFTLFATHFHELTYLSDEIPQVKNFHVTALIKDEDFVLLYKVERGVCDQSFGIEVAELAHFPKHIIQMARDKISEFEALEGCNFMKGKRCDEPSAKRRKTEEADEIISDFLEKVKALPIDKMTDDEIAQEMEKLKLEVKKCDNAQIQKLIELATTNKKKV